MKPLPAGCVRSRVLLLPSTERSPARPGCARGALAEQTHLGSCLLCPASLKSQPGSMRGAARCSQLSSSIKEKVAGEGGDGLPLLREEGMPAASARVLPYQLPAMPFHFFFPPGDNSLSKLGSRGEANLSADFRAWTSAP